MIAPVLISLFAVAVALAAWWIARTDGEPPDAWDMWNTPRGTSADTAVWPAPASASGRVVRSDTEPGEWVCAAPAPGMPGGICGWPAGSKKECPDHGPLPVPDQQERGQ